MQLASVMKTKHHSLNAESINTILKFEGHREPTHQIHKRADIIMFAIPVDQVFITAYQLLLSKLG